MENKGLKPLTDFLQSYGGNETKKKIILLVIFVLNHFRMANDFEKMG